MPVPFRRRPFDRIEYFAFILTVVGSLVLYYYLRRSGWVRVTYFAALLVIAMCFRLANERRAIGAKLRMSYPASAGEVRVSTISLGTNSLP